MEQYKKLNKLMKIKGDFFYLILIAVVLATILIACYKDENGQSKVDVYIAGCDGYGGATLWKNGVAQRLSDDSEAFSVFVSGRDVYVAGEEYIQDGYYPMLWKNGVAQKLSNNYGRASSVYVSGQDVYVAGSESIQGRSYPTLWKNGIAQHLSDGGIVSIASSVFVSGNDVYVAVDNALWKNGVVQQLESCTRAISVFVSGNDWYVAGMENTYFGAALWKNGTLQRLTSQYRNGSAAESVFVSGNDVYAVGIGQLNWDAILWKNGVAQFLTNEEYAKLVEPYSVFVSGNDVYVILFEEVEEKGERNHYLTLWKNGTTQRILDYSRPDVTAYSVFVVEKK